MNATDILSQEHRVIERVIDALWQASEKLGQGQPVRPGFFLDAAEFIKGFADGCHHKKEEGILFKAMAERGVPVQGGPIGVMLYEHDLGRQYTAGMRQAAASLQAGDLSARDAVLENARNYALLLRQHIAKEDNVLFPLAGRVIPLELQTQVEEDFEHIEHDETGEGVHERFLALADALESEAAQK